MRRTIYGVTTQSATGLPFTAALAESPKAGQKWKIIRLTIEVPNYTTGAIQARMFVAGRFIAGSAQGQSDSYYGGAETVNASELVTVTWSPTAVPGIVQGRVIAEVEVVRA